MTKSPSQQLKFRGVFDTHRGAVWSYCYRRLDRDDVPDAVGDVFLVAWRKIDQCPDGPEALPWLYGVARNVVRNASRSSRRRVRLGSKLGSLGVPPVEPPEVQVIRRAEDQVLLDAVARLAPSERELLRLRAWEGLSYGEIAAVVGLSARATESRITRTRKKLAAQLAHSLGSSSLAQPRHIEQGGER